MAEALPSTSSISKKQQNIQMLIERLKELNTSENETPEDTRIFVRIESKYLCIYNECF